MKTVEIEVITDEKFGESDSAIVNVWPEGDWVLRDGYSFRNIDGYPLCLLELKDDYTLEIGDSITFYYSDSGSLHTTCFSKLSRNRYLLEYSSDRIIASQDIIKVVKNYYGFGPNSVSSVYSYFASKGKKEDPSYHLFTCKVHDSIDNFIVSTFAEEFMPKRAHIDVRNKNFGSVTLFHQVDHVYTNR